MAMAWTLRPWTRHEYHRSSIVQKIKIFLSFAFGAQSHPSVALENHIEKHLFLTDVEARKVTMEYVFCPWKDINDIADDVLQGILKYGTIETTVSKDRVSKRFKTINDEILKRKKKLFTIGGHFKKPDYSDDYFFNNVLNGLKRMPKLTDGTQLNIRQWNDAEVSKLARINPNLVRFQSSHKSLEYDTKNIIKYICRVKDSDPSYTGQDIKCVFIKRQLINRLSDARLSDDQFIEMKLKLFLSSDWIHMDGGVGSNVYWRLKLLNQDRLTESWPTVEQLVLPVSYPHFEDIKLVPNVRSLFLYQMYRREKELRLKELSKYIGTNLKELAIYTHYWTNDDTTDLIRIINTTSIERLLVIQTGQYGHEIMQSILQSPKRTIKYVQLNHVKIENGTLTIGSVRYLDQVKDILIRFEHINEILFNINVDKNSTEILLCIEDIQRLRNVYRRRSLSFTFGKNLIHVNRTSSDSSSRTANGAAIPVIQID